nr:MerR family transcriptional regulator [Microvirga sp. HBU65207]
MDHIIGSTPAGESARLYTIGDLAREFGVTLRTLRFYEDRGLLSPRRDGTARIYDARDRERLSVILKGKQLGFTLTEIRAMVAEERSGNGAAMNLKLSLDQIEDQIRLSSSRRARSKRPWPSSRPAARASPWRPEPQRRNAIVRDSPSVRRPLVCGRMGVFAWEGGKAGPPPAEALAPPR